MMICNCRQLVRALLVKRTEEISEIGIDDILSEPLVDFGSDGAEMMRTMMMLMMAPGFRPAAWPSPKSKALRHARYFRRPR